MVVGDEGSFDRRSEEVLGNTRSPSIPSFH